MAALSLTARGWLCLTPLVAFALDLGLTLLGQEQRYWRGEYEAAIEYNPLWYPLLTFHPIAFLGAVFCCPLAYASLLLLWNHRFAVVIAVFMALQHAIGAASWLARNGLWGWFAAILVIALLERLQTLSWRRAGILGA